MDSDSLQQAAYQVRLLAMNALFEQIRLHAGSDATVGSIVALAKMAEKAEQGVLPAAQADLDDLQAHLFYHALLS